MEILATKIFFISKFNLFKDTFSVGFKGIHLAGFHQDDILGNVHNHAVETIFNMVSSYKEVVLF